MLRSIGLFLLLSSPSLAAPTVGEDVGALGPSGAKQAPAFLLTEEYRDDFRRAKKCPLLSSDGDVVYVGRRAVYADDKKQGVVVLLDEFARRYALNYCWQ